MNTILKHYDSRVAKLSSLIYFAVSLPHLLLLTSASVLAAKTFAGAAMARLFELHPVLPWAVVFGFWAIVFLSFQRAGYLNHFVAMRGAATRATNGKGSVVAAAGLGATAAGAYLNYHDKDTSSSSSTDLFSGPRVNIDGTPMLSDAFDIYGNPFGITSSTPDIGDSLSDSKPAFNIDGSPMMGDFDIHGHVYGQTDMPGMDDHAFGSAGLSDHSFPDHSSTDHFMDSNSSSMSDPFNTD